MSDVILDLIEDVSRGAYLGGGRITEMRLTPHNYASFVREIMPKENMRAFGNTFCTAFGNIKIIPDSTIPNDSIMFWANVNEHGKEYGGNCLLVKNIKFGSKEETILQKKSGRRVELGEEW